jgi:hypothetical protein
MIDFYFIIAGIEGGIEAYTAKITWCEIVQNEGEHKDTEMMYTFRETETEKIKDAINNKGEYFLVNTYRDCKNNVALISCVNYDIYKELKTTEHL